MSKGERMKDFKEDSRPNKGLWASGDYCCKCLICGDGFIGAKRSIHCADCAYSQEGEVDVKELLPCPFCGSEPEQLDNTKSVWVKHKKECFLRPIYAFTGKNQIKWNTRTPKQL